MPVTALLLGALLVFQTTAAVQPDVMPAVLPLRAQAELHDRWLEQRLDSVVPALMRRAEIDMWIVSAREYDEDPVLATMLPSTWLRARRRTILVFFDPGGEAPVERLAVARYDVGHFFAKSWDKQAEPDQWAALAALVAARDPARIALDVSPTFALADGLSASEREGMLGAWSAALRGRVVSAEALAIGWLETRTAEEMEVYPTICRIAHVILAEGLSERVIQPGYTTTRDLEWWFRERVRGLGLDTWFHPTVSLQRDEGETPSGSFASKPEARTIRRGDLLHVDFGITYVDLNTDTQWHAYVLRNGEREAPQGLRDALAIGHRMQDILMSNFVLGRSGNEILSRTLDQARAEAIVGRIYTHPLGYHGHGAGPTIGLWDQQDGVPGRGDYALNANTAHSIELGVEVDVPEWGQRTVHIMLEEDAFFDGQRIEFIDGRQSAFVLIP